MKLFKAEPPMVLLTFSWLTKKTPGRRLFDKGIKKGWDVLS